MEKRVKEFLDGFSVNSILATVFAAVFLLFGLIGFIKGGWQGVKEVMAILLLVGGVVAFVLGLFWLCFYIADREDV